MRNNNWHVLFISPPSQQPQSSSSRISCTHNTSPSHLTNTAKIPRLSPTYAGPVCTAVSCMITPCRSAFSGLVCFARRPDAARNLYRSSFIYNERTLHRFSGQRPYNNYSIHTYRRSEFGRTNGRTADLHLSGRKQSNTGQGCAEQ